MRMVMMLMLGIVLEQKGANEVYAKAECRDSDGLIKVDG